MSDNQVDLPPRSNESRLTELVWAHNPTTKTKPKQMTRGKLAILQRAGYEETSDPHTQPAQQPAAEPAPDDQSAARAAARRASTSEPKEQS